MTLVECPRDAIQGITKFIDTSKKIEYLNYLLRSNIFDIIDFGSFVSPKVIPQMADSSEVLKGLDLSQSKSKLLAIVINERGAIAAAEEEKITYLGYPFSISEIFQMRNANSTIAESFERVKKIVEICNVKNKNLVLYISMAFGNPYGEAWSYDLVLEWIEKLKNLGIKEFSLADTTGMAELKDIKNLFELNKKNFPDLNIGTHFHSTPDSWQNKVQTAYDAGCRKFDGAILGFGGCPMAKDDLTGNVPMEGILKLYTDVNLNEIEKLKIAFLSLIN